MASGFPAIAPVLRVVPEAALQAQERAADQKQEETNQATLTAQTASQLAGYIREQFTTMKNHRNTSAGWNERLLSALRMFNGQYDPGKLQAIRQFQGSEVYAHLVAMKCRGTTSLLRDI